MSSKFGDFISDKRKACEITLRGMASTLGMTAPYLSDIEKGRRNPPNFEILDKMSKLLHLTQGERDEMFDLAGEEKNQLSPDLPIYIMDMPEARTALRTARNKGKDAKFWNSVLEKLNEEE